MTTQHRLIYVAEPIDQANGVRKWTGINALATRGVAVFRPASAFIVSGSAKPGPEIHDVNHTALTRATGVLAYLPAGVPSVGVPAEIQMAAKQIGCPVAIITDLDEKSWSLQGWLRLPHVQSFGTGPASQLAAVQWLLSQEPMGKLERSQALAFATTTDGGPYGDPVPPRRAYRDDAGFDLATLEDTIVPAGSYVDVPTGIAVGMPSHLWGLIMGRSSTLRKRGLMVNQAVIDAGYRGELFVGVFNMSNVDDHEIKPGERIAQFIPMTNHGYLAPVLVDDLPKPADGRGLAGFGSSGR